MGISQGNVAALMYPNLDCLLNLVRSNRETFSCFMFPPVDDFKDKICVIHNLHA